MKLYFFLIFFACMQVIAFAQDTLKPAVRFIDTTISNDWSPYLREKIATENLDENFIEKPELKRYGNRKPALYKNTDNVMESQTAVLKYIRKISKKFEKMATGTAFVKFTVDETGKVINVQMMKGINDEVDELILEQFRKMPQWTPAERDGEKIAESCIIPVSLRHR